LNKAVRETAQETLSAIFTSTDKVSAEEVSKRMEGFGNTNFDSSPRDVKKSMLDDMMGFGSSTIRQMSGLASSGSSGNYGSSNSGTYRYYYFRTIRLHLNVSYYENGESPPPNIIHTCEEIVSSMNSGLPCSGFPSNHSTEAWGRRVLVQFCASLP
jgi:hypothetical protein